MKTIIFLLLSLISLASEMYDGQTKEEKQILEKYRNKEIVLVLDNDLYKNETIDGESINSLIEDLFSYLGMNFKVEKVDFIDDEYDKKNKFLGGIYKINNERKDIVTSNPLYTENLYLVFDNLDSKLDKENFNLYKKLFDFYSIYDNFKQKLTAEELKKVENNEYSLYSTQKAISYSQKIKISMLPDKVIGVPLEYADLLTIINYVIKDRYYDKFNVFLNKRNISIENEKLDTILTLSEKKYLSENKVINIAVEKGQDYGHYSNEEKKYVGSLITLLDNLSNVLKVDFNVKNKISDDFNDISEMFKNKDVKIIPLIKTKERSEKYLFSSELSKITLYKVKPFVNFYKTLDLRVGVIKDSFEQQYANLYHEKNLIKLYSDYPEMNEALDKGEIDHIYTTNTADIKISNIVLKEGEFPLVLVFHKEDEILRDILNKALSRFGDLTNTFEKGALNKNYTLHKEQITIKNHNKKLSFGISSLLIMLFLGIYGFFKQNRNAKKLLVDHVTGLPNYYKYLETTQKCDALDCFFIRVKVNTLSEINRKLGWNVGNKLILQISTSLKNIFNLNGDIIYKISGDKFYILTKQKDIDTKILQIKDIIKDLNLREKYDFDEDIKITFYNKKTSISVSEVFEYLEMLDEATEIKEISIVKLDDYLIEKLNRRKEIQKLLIEKNIDGIYPVFQPKFDIQTKKILGAEALARWQSEKLGFIYPNEFIGLAEEYKKVFLIDYKIAEETLKFIKKIPEKYLNENNFKISFNISLQTFEREDFLDTITNLIDKYEIDSKNIEVELTETILALNLSTVIEKINELKKKKIHVSIDDFTAGNSSVSLLSILPVDTIKFDKSILDRITDENNIAQNIYKGLIDMVKTADFKIVSEGIETQEQLDFLKKNMVKTGQGYIFSKPITEKEFLALIQL
ncbi:MAG: EAL domain-containing protein [Cetobacterium sp.]